MTREEQKTQDKNRKAERQSKATFQGFMSAERAQTEANQDYGFRLNRGGSR
jgi:hypothetical protein